MEVIESNKMYRTFYIENSLYKTIIVLTSCTPPSQLFNFIINELSFSKIKGKILIDSLLYCGNTKERYIEADFDPDSNCGLSSFKYVNINRDDRLRVLTSQYLREHAKLLEYSVLSSIQKRLLLKGCNL